jgi:peptide/nickel transport system substrate-binding protein
MHPRIPDYQKQLAEGKITRREFLRFTTLLGLSASSALALAACGQPAAAPEPTQAPAPTAAPAAPASAEAPKPTEAPESSITRGGELRLSHAVQKMTDPASTEWFQFNIYRNVAEYLTVTNVDNITEPWLLEKWEASDDIKTWTLYLRKGIKFNHGPELMADDVIFNFKRWLDPNSGSSIGPMIGAYLKPEGIEKVDDYTVRLNLTAPQVAVPEHLNHYQGVILPKDFGGDWLKQPYGTGPYTLEEYVVDERAVLKARKDYWRMGEDGQPLPYLDGIRFVYLGVDTAPILAAITSGEVDFTQLQISMLDALKGTDIQVATQISSYTNVIRMRADKKPWDDAKVRNALKACVDREAMRKATMRDYGAIGGDYHVAPIHPEYCPMDPPKRDIEKAKSLLSEAGYPDGLKVVMSVMEAEPEIIIAQLLKAQCAPAGIDMELNVMPASMYWDQWTEVDLGITSWTHRPLATMVLALAYRCGVEWNETHWCNAKFDELLAKAEGTLAMEDRRKIMCEIQTLMQEEGPIIIPRWGAFLWGHRPSVRGFRAAPSDFIILDDVWLDQA